MKKQYFKNIKEHLESLGFQQSKLPYRMEGIMFDIIQVKDESERFPEVNPTIYTIEHRRYQDTQYRGKLPNPETVDLILELIYEL